MARSSQIVQELKSQLKTQRLTYRDLAHELELSESAVKQMFASGNMTLTRLDKICEILGFDVSALIQMTDDAGKQLDSLSLEQEAELVGDAKLLLVTYCIVNLWTFTEILNQYELTEAEGIRFSWQPNGPIENYFQKEVQGPFFHSDFTDEGCMRLVKNGDISVVGRQQILDRMHSLGQLFDDTARDEKTLQFEQRQGTTMVVAIRNWIFPAFEALERK